MGPAPPDFPADHQRQGTEPTAATQPRTAVDAAVVGAGIAGLTVAALLASEGWTVELLEAHHQSGGCAGTFRRGPYVFDVGATQVAGLEAGGVHARLFRRLGVAPPPAEPLDPACVVDLGDGGPPVRVWRDPERWALERRRLFPGSERFWSLCDAIHQANWGFAARQPVLPPRSTWDLSQLLKAIRPANLASGLLCGATMADLLRWAGGGPQAQRLRRFLDLQLKLYSQEPADRTAVLYGVTALAMAQAPQGLWHLQGSMQQLSLRLEQALHHHGGRLRCRHRVTRLQPAAGGPGHLWQLEGEGQGGLPWQLAAHQVVVTLPPQTLPGLLGPHLPGGYGRRLAGLNEPSGALVFYGAIDRQRLPYGCPAHLQLAWDDPGPLFVSISREGDGRAPLGQATVIASVFSAARPWFGLEETAYQARKAEALRGLLAGLERLLGIAGEDWRHAELATPRGWAGWTGRPWGYVGGQGQHPSRFGLFGLASRSPLPGLWLGGDAIHPGEGTAGVSLSAEMIWRQMTNGDARQPANRAAAAVVTGKAAAAPDSG